MHRVNTLAQLLFRLEPETATSITVKHINKLAAQTTDTPSGVTTNIFVASLLDELLAALIPERDSRLPQIISLFNNWNRLQVDDDGNGRYDHPAVALFNTWWEMLTSRIFAYELGESVDPHTVANLLSRLLEKEAAALPLHADYLDGTSASVAVSDALVDALDTLTRRHQSTDPGDWLQATATIHWQAKRQRKRSRYHLDEPRGTYNQIVHLTKGGIHAENVVAPGQAGKHFAGPRLITRNALIFRFVASAQFDAQPKLAIPIRCLRYPAT